MNTKKISYMGIYLAIIMLMGFTPFLGFIPLPGISLAIILVPIIVCSIHMGSLGSIFAWTTFAITSFVEAYYKGSPVIVHIAYTHPFKWFLISFVSRVIIGLSLAGLNIAIKNLNLMFRYWIISFLALFLNTLLFIGFLSILIPDKTFFALLATVWINILVEWTVIPLTVFGTYPIIKVNKIH